MSIQSNMSLTESINHSISKASAHENNTKRKGWVVTDGKTGADVQCKGVAEALGIEYEMKKISPVIPWKWIAPWGPVAPWHKAEKPNSPLKSPWPDIAIAAGRASIPYLQEIRKAAGDKTFTVVLQDPRMGNKIADLIWVPEHDPLRGTNVITSVASPHSHNPKKLHAMRAAANNILDSLPYPRVMIAIGGPNGVYNFTSEPLNNFVNAIQDLGKLGASFMVTPSRRTPRDLLKIVEKATRDRPRVMWDGTGDNPYQQYLANADYLIVTADSINMTGEACATGRPVYVFTPDGGSSKFDKFHEAMRQYGATRPLPKTISQLEKWSYVPLDSACDIAREIERRW